MILKETLSEEMKQRKIPFLWFQEKYTITFYTFDLYKSSIERLVDCFVPACFVKKYKYIEWKPNIIDEEIYLKERI